MTSSFILYAMNTLVANRLSICLARMITMEKTSSDSKRWGNAYYSAKKDYGWATFENNFSRSLRKFM